MNENNISNKRYIGLFLSHMNFCIDRDTEI